MCNNVCIVTQYFKCFNNIAVILQSKEVGRRKIHNSINKSEMYCIGSSHI